MQPGSEPHHIDLMKRGIKIQHLRLIVELDETGQMSKAAENLHISQPAASRLASELEHICGVTLYVRHPRGVMLTDYGQHLALRARILVQGLHNAGREISELNSGDAGQVNLGSVTGPALELVIPVLKRMRITHSRVESSVNVEISDLMAQDLLNNKLDFYIGRIPDHLDARLFNAHVLGEEPAALIVREGHPLTRQTDISLADCVRYDWVMQSQDGWLSRTFEDYLLRQGLPFPTKVLKTSSILLSLATITETNAIAPVARAVADFFGDTLGSGKFIRRLPVAGDLSVSDFALVKKANSILPPAAQIFYDYLIEQHATNSK